VEQLLGFIAIHRGSHEHPAFGATRIAEYRDATSALSDVLSLSSLMSQKAALAGISYGGGKGVLFNGPHMKDSSLRKRTLEVYAKHVDRLGGKFITGSDAGVTQDDVNLMRTFSPHIVGVQEDPTRRTAEGVLGSIFVTLAHLFGEPTLSGKTFAIQGVGKVGGAVLDLIAGDAKEVIISDIDASRIEEVKKKYPNVKVVSPEAIITSAVDILVPCAMGGILSRESVETIRAKAIVGAANNQLSSREAGDVLHERGILYAPDYVVNAGGLIGVVHEYEKTHKNNFDGDIEHDIATIQTRLMDMLMESKKNNIPVHRIADTTARLRIEALYSTPTENA
jgi:leucine dehydrogenase